MTEREDFLNALAEKAGRPRHQLQAHPFKPMNDLPETTLADQTPQALAALAKQNSEAVHVTYQTTTTAALPHALDAFLQAKAATALLLPTSAQFARYQLENWRASVSPKPQYWLPDAGREANLKAASEADAAIGFADFLLAESGTITVATTPGQGRAFHFLPTHYLAIIPASRIVARSRQAATWYDQEIKAGRLTTSNINFITGPSNSGDIEMVLIVGVHGPLDMTYLVVEDQ
ncbi:lactate utilization protein C [Lacticaseibacillus jixianensis]|uniref:Lactate utilization protein C n=1 Tax=Lacticaseibacillus jixianensis TaxID=2486012 RepID=A0ABW4B9Y7_9LACO|nr:lactate utilization protein C [Lacticaseibacillus jixianensis]